MTVDAVNDVVADAFSHSLKIHSIESIALSRRTMKYVLAGYKNSSREVLHRIATALLLNKLKICRDRSRGNLAGFYKGIYILYPAKEVHQSDATVVRIDEPCSQDVSKQISALFTDIVSKTPMFMIDLSLWELHHEKEKLKLLRQMLISINVIRKWLTDYHLVFVSAPSEALTRLSSYTLFSCPWHNTSTIYSLMDSSRTVMLDPYADETLSVKDVFHYDYFIIGGIVDRLYPRPYATYMIYKLHSLKVKRKAIKLKGSAIGVPNEINKVIDIILNVRLGDKDIEEAVIENMGVDDRVLRVVYELKKVYKYRGGISYSDIVEHMKMYRLSESYLRRILARVREMISM